MTRSKFLLTNMTALGAIALLAQPLSAMTCAEFDAMDEDGQMQAVNEMAEAGDAVREGEPLEEGAEGTDDAAEVEVDEATDSDTPRDEARAEDRGGEMITVIKQECANDADFDMSTVTMTAPKDK